MTAVQKRKAEVQQGFTEEQISLIKSQIAPEATNEELKLFVYHAQRTGLDPLARQIYCIHRNVKLPNGSYGKKMTIQTSIDGFRVIAERSGSYAGQSEPKFEEDAKGSPTKCSISVFRFANKSAGLRYEAAIGVARWSEYVQTDREGRPMGLWQKMPHTMLAKVAEALALRKAFPQDLSGIYTGDEIATESEYPSEMQTKTIPIQAQPVEAAQAETPPEPYTKEQFEKLEKLLMASENAIMLKKTWDSIPAGPLKNALAPVKDKRKKELQPKPPISDEEFTRCLKAIQEGMPDEVERLEANYTLTDTQKETLNKILG